MSELSGLGLLLGAAVLEQRECRATTNNVITHQLSDRVWAGVSVYSAFHFHLRNNIRIAELIFNVNIQARNCDVIRTEVV